MYIQQSQNVSVIDSNSIQQRFGRDFFQLAHMVVSGERLSHIMSELEFYKTNKVIFIVVNVKGWRGVDFIAEEEEAAIGSAFRVETAVFPSTDKLEFSKE